MLPIAADIASRLTRDHAQSALAGAPRLREPAKPRPRPAREGRRRVLANALRGLAATSAALADRLEAPARRA